MEGPPRSVRSEEMKEFEVGIGVVNNHARVTLRTGSCMSSRRPWPMANVTPRCEQRPCRIDKCPDGGCQLAELCYADSDKTSYKIVCVPARQRQQYQRHVTLWRIITSEADIYEAATRAANHVGVQYQFLAADCFRFAKCLLSKIMLGAGIPDPVRKGQGDRVMAFTLYAIDSSYNGSLGTAIRRYDMMDRVFWEQPGWRRDYGRPCRRRYPLPTRHATVGVPRCHGFELLKLPPWHPQRRAYRTRHNVWCSRGSCVQGKVKE